LELSSSLLDLWFGNIAEALLLLQENPEVFVGDVDYPFSCLRFQANDNNDIFASFLVLQNKLYGGLVQTSLNVEFEKKWEEEVKKDELYTTFRQSLSSYLSEIKTLNSPDDKRIQRLQELLSEL
jgi:hypothetical protein